MKQIFQSFLHGAYIALLGLALGSCGDFLEITPRDMVTEDNFWDEKTDVDQMVTGCYTAMQSSDFISRCIIWGDMRGPDVDGASNASEFDDLYQALVNNLMPSNQFTDWSSFYYVINKCNTIIRMAPEVHEKDPSYRQSDLQATIAEMTALRSLCYWYLIRAFDAVPFYRESVQQEDEVQYLPPTSFDAVLNELISDLESVKSSALDHYASTGSNDTELGSFNSNCNRITRSAINAMLCDMYLWRGDYDKVIACADEILAVKQGDYERNHSHTMMAGSYVPEVMAASSGNFTTYLYKNTQSDGNNVFNAIFGVGNSFESIFELSFNSTNRYSAYISSYALSNLYGTGNRDDKYGPVNNGSGYLEPMGAIVAEAQGTSGKWEVFRGFSDTRYYCSLMADDSYTEGSIRKGVAATFQITQSGNKYINTETTTAMAPFVLTSAMDRNWIFYRLTDVMLMKAEAYLMKSTAEASDANKALWASAYDLIEVVANRSVTTAAQQLKSTDGATSDREELQKLLRYERRAELMFEGKSWFDMIRYAKQAGGDISSFKDVPAKCGARGSSNPFPSWAHLFWPYNKQEVKKNPNLTQKSIYNKDTEDFSINN